jgi:hypothetical protein
MCPRELQILQVHFPIKFLLKTIRNLLPEARDPPGPFSYQILIKNNKEFAPVSSGSSRSISITILYEKQEGNWLLFSGSYLVHFPYCFLLKSKLIFDETTRVGPPGSYGPRPYGQGVDSSLKPFFLLWPLKRKVWGLRGSFSYCFSYWPFKT